MNGLAGRIGLLGAPTLPQVEAATVESQRETWTRRALVVAVFLLAAYLVYRIARR
jgi:hypothetical protein